MDVAIFKEIVWEYYHENERDLPWRMPESDDTFKPYKIMVSEVMLQQTQAQRVISKYHEFLKEFPTVGTLAEAPLQAVLAVWSGLGYNRRAKFIWQAAQQVMQQHSGTFPESLDELVALPGIGNNTAQAIRAYAYNQPVVFIETNIRTIFIHHFFPDDDQVSDTQLLPLIERALDHEHPREWYWALMDYGVHLKATIGNASRSSKHYAKQSKFHGSRRQVRGQIIRLLTNGSATIRVIESQIQDDRLTSVISDLIAESLVTDNNGVLSL